jgi:hypothetical protein
VFDVLRLFKQAWTIEGDEDITGFIIAEEKWRVGIAS